MEIDNKAICHVCLKMENENTSDVFVLAKCRGEEVHICTSCIPSVIHGSGEVVKTKEEVLQAKG